MIYSTTFVGWENPCLGDFIPQNDPVRVVHRIIEQINLEELYRRYSPKGCSAYQIKWIENKLNNRPRKRLGYLTPNEKFILH